MKAIKSTHFTDYYIQIIYEQFTKKNSPSLKEKGQTIRNKHEKGFIAQYKCISEDHSILNKITVAQEQIIAINTAHGNPRHKQAAGSRLLDERTHTRSDFGA